MKNFGYCIWLTNKYKKKYSNLTNGFKLHLTIKSELSLNEAEELKKKINNIGNIAVRIKEPIVYTKEINFYALLCNASLDLNQSNNFTNLSEFWPKNAHISFYYSYEDITNSIINKLKNSIDYNQLFYFDTIEIRKCTNHFNEW